MTYKSGGILSRTISQGAKLLPYAVYIHCRPIRRELNKEIRTILDVGCGQGLVARYGIHHRNTFMVGADIFEPDLRIAQKRNAHKDYILCDARRLPFRAKSFDVVLCVELLEHLDKGEGLKLIKNIEGIAIRKVIISTPVGFLNNDPESNRSRQDDVNPYQEHKGGWGVDELRALGYKVYYNNYLHRLEEFLSNRRRTWSWMLCVVIISLLAPLNWLSPNFGSHLFCVKNVEPAG